MEIRQVLLARSIQMIKASGTLGYLPEIAEKIRDRYEFVVSPKAEDLLPPSSGAEPKGAEFKHGRLKIDGRFLIIQQLTVFQDGVVADTATSTDNSDLFVGDLARWAEHEDLGVTSVGPKLYLSQLEVQTSAPLESYAPVFGSFGRTISALLKAYGFNVAPYQFSSVILNFDPIGAIPPQPGIFQLERRVNARYQDNLWFAQAPLRTSDHIKLLNDLERQP